MTIEKVTRHENIANCQLPIADCQLTRDARYGLKQLGLASPHSAIASGYRLPPDGTDITSLRANWQLAIANRQWSLSQGKSRIATRLGLLYLSSPIFVIARGIWRFRINHSQTLPVRMFSALSKMMPTLMPITSLSIQPVCGLKASTKP